MTVANHRGFALRAQASAVWALADTQPRGHNGLGMLPDVIVHADWSASEAKKRVAVTARLLPDHRYWIDAPKTVGRTGPWRERFGIPAGINGTFLIAFDFPIGIPAAYAQRVGITSFRDALPKFGDGRWRDFYDVCREAAEINLYRPFYPYSPGGRSQKDLTTALGISWEDLHRRCELKTADRRAACPLFWTLGGNQVGRAALSGWREVVVPILSESKLAGLWPFDGPLVDLLESRSCVIVETYPTELYAHLGVRLPLSDKGGKRKQPAREHYATQLLAKAAEVDAELSESARDLVASGFGYSPDGEDPFDAMVGLLGILKHLRTGATAEPAPDTALVSVEGWILGQRPPAA